MGETPCVSLLKATKTPKYRARIVALKEGEDDYEQPLSPGARFFHEPGYNVYIIAQMGVKDPIDVDELKANIPIILDKYRCFSRLAVTDKNGNMRWVPTRVNVDDHVIVPKIDPNMESADKFVEDYISNLTGSCIEYSKPLWDVHILNTKTSNGQGTYVLRAHHSLGDGMSFINLLLSYSRQASDPKALPTLPVNKKSHHHTTRVTNFISFCMVVWNTLVALVLFVFTTMFLKDTETPMKASNGVEDRPRRIVTRSVSLDDIKVVKNAMDATVNDVIVGVIQAGFNRYLNRRFGENNKPVPENIRLRAMISYNMRASTNVEAPSSNAVNEHETWGYKVGYILLPFNVKYRSDPLDYVREARAIMERRKASLEPFATRFYAKLLIEKLFGMKVAGKLNRKVYYNTTFCFSNIPGPKQRICFLGQEVTYVAPSLYGIPSALMIHVVSYVDKVTFILSADEETIPDPQKLCDDLQQSLQHIKCSVLAKPCVEN
ncbi:hypothetical protein L2E82_39089 [Cichorium intybus]|uniref:Uncharacterized protein n=1 Tax=Cichorium intybus TaxID=13427 RepID=A0ACB9AI84_CICIN|nr:hypothetical protein L2E82_39089 [Cichorium intybus]